MKANFIRKSIARHTDPDGKQQYNYSMAEYIRIPYWEKNNIESILEREILNRREL